MCLPAVHPAAIHRCGALSGLRTQAGGKIKIKTMSSECVLIVYLVTLPRRALLALLAMTWYDSFIFSCRGDRLLFDVARRRRGRFATQILSSSGKSYNATPSWLQEALEGLEKMDFS